MNNIAAQYINKPAAGQQRSNEKMCIWLVQSFSVFSDRTICRLQTSSLLNTHTPTAEKKPPNRKCYLRAQTHNRTYYKNYRMHGISCGWCSWECPVNELMWVRVTNYTMHHTIYWSTSWYLHHIYTCKLVCIRFNFVHAYMYFSHS